MKEKILKRAFDKEIRLSYLAKPGIHNAVVICDSLKPSFNIGKIFRSANAFGINEVHVVNTPVFNPYPALGSLRQVPSKFWGSFRESYESLKANNYSFFALDISETNYITKKILPKKSAFIIGHEENGFSFDFKDYKDIEVLSIPQFGTVQSLNASVAGSIAMYEYVRQHSSSDSKQ